MPFHADGDQLDKFAELMETKHADIEKMIGQASGHAETLAGGNNWGGFAGNTFQSTFEQFKASARKMNDALLANAENLKTAGKKYSEMETQNLDHLQAAAGGHLDWT